MKTRWHTRCLPVATLDCGPRLPCLSWALALLVIAAEAQTTNPAYLREMPSAQRVKSELKGADAMDTAARQMGAFWQLQEIIKNLAGPRLWRNQLTPDEQRLLGQYYTAYQAAAQPYAYIQNSPSHPDKPTWNKLHSFYETDDGFRDELLGRFCSTQFRTQYLQAKGRFDARAVARSQAATQARTQPPAQVTSGTRDNGEVAAQAVQQLAQQLSNLITQLATSESNDSQSGLAEQYWRQGNRYLDVRKCAEAIESFKKANAIDPASAAYNDMGRAHFCRVQYSEAEAAFKEALWLKPDNDPALLNLGIAYSAQTKFSDAQRVYFALKARNSSMAQQLYEEIQEARAANEQKKKTLDLYNQRNAETVSHK